MILCALIATTCFAQNTTDSQGRKQGKWEKYNGDTLLYKGQFKDNVPFGVFEYFYADGTLKSTTEFLNGVVNVKTTIYYSGNKKASEGAFVDQKDGEWKYWSENGNLLKVENYNKGTKHGEWKTFMKDSTILLLEENYKNGLKDGPSVTYYEDGSVSIREHYINGLLNGQSQLYTLGNVLYSEGTYHNNYKIGVWNFYDEEQNLRKEIYFNKSIPDTVFLCFYNNGHEVKVRQNEIAYFQMEGRGTAIIMMNETKHTITDDMETAKMWSDFISFCPVLPNLYASINAIIGYDVIDEESILVKMKPDPGYEVVAQGDEMNAVKQLFNTEIPKEEE